MSVATHLMWRNPLLIVAPGLISACLCVAAGARADEPAVIKVDAPKIINGPSLAHGYLPRKKDQEAELVLRIRVEADGTASRVDVLDGFYNAAYVNGATRFAKALHFSPARRDGVAIPEDFLLRLTLLRPDQTPRMGRMLTPEFQEALATALRMIDANDLEGARMHVEHMVADEVKSRYEYAIMRAVLAETYERTGHPFEALVNCQSATMRTEEGLGKYAPGATAPRNVASRYRLQEPMLSATLRRCIQLDASLGHYYDALNTYLELAGLAKLAPDEPLAHVIRQLEQRLQDDSLLVARVQIGREGFYRHLPYRTVFSVADVQHGTLRTIRARCGKEQRELTPIDGRSWQMPASWKDCELMFLGDAGTQFSVVESTADAGSAGTVIVE